MEHFRLKFTKMTCEEASVMLMSDTRGSQNGHVFSVTVAAYPLLRRYVVPTGQGTGGAYRSPVNSGSGTHTCRDKSSLSLKP